MPWKSIKPDVARGDLRWTGAGTWAALRRRRTEVLVSTPGPRLWCSFPCGRGVASRTPQIQTLLCCAPLRVSQCVCASVLRKDALSGTCLLFHCQVACCTTPSRARQLLVGMSATRILVCDYLSPEPANEVIRMLLILFCPPVGTSVVPPHNERRCRYRYRRLSGICTLPEYHAENLRRLYGPDTNTGSG